MEKEGDGGTQKSPAGGGGDLQQSFVKEKTKQTYVFPFFPLAEEGWNQVLINLTGRKGGEKRANEEKRGEKREVTASQFIGQRRGREGSVVISI